MTDQAEQIRIFKEIMDNCEKGFLSMVRQTALANEEEDLYQDIRTHIWQSLGGFREQSSPVTWAWRLAMNRIKTRLKMETNRIRAMRQYAQEVQSGPIGGRDQDAMLRDFIQSLSGLNRDIFMMIQSNMSYAEIARITGQTEDALRARIKRVKRQFKNRYL